jgi:hypothetical protein
MKKILIFQIFILGIIHSYSALSQGTSQPLAARLTVKSFISMKVNKSQNMDFKFNNTEQMEQGITKPNAFNVEIKSNQNWNLSISSLTPNFLALGPDSQTLLPSSVLGLRKGSTSSFVSVTQNPNTLASGSRGSNTSGNQFTLDLKATPGLNFDGGSFTIVVVFTVSPQ